MAYSAIDQSGNHVAGRYTEDLLDNLEPGTLLLVSGDEHGGPLAYAQAVEGKRPDVTLVLLPLIKGKWYIRHLQARYPDLQIPTQSAGRPLTLTVKDLVDANQGRPIAMVGPSVDKSLEGAYGYIRHGLVSQVEPVTRTFNLVTIAAENDALLRRYQPPSPAGIKEKTFESTLLQSYAAPAEWVARQYQEVGRYAEARTWYERALAIDPSYADAQEGLAAVSLAGERQ
jgi:tetratricopeptide (TPR) repeat protein